MRVLFDAFWWERGPIANRTVMKEFVRAWILAHPDDEVVLALPRHDIARAGLPVGVRAVATNLRPHAASNMLELGRIARREKADATIAHNYTPLLGHGTNVVFIHDLLFEERPEWFSLKERAYFWPMGRAARRAAAVATSTRTEAARIERLHPSLGPVGVTGLDVSTALKEATARRPDAVAEGTDFLLTVGRLNARKNLAGAIGGFLASDAARSGRKLLIVGSSEYSGRAPELGGELGSAVAEGRVVFLGRLDDGELRWLYENTDGVLFLSFDEGFGLPGIEAQHFGAPVVASDIAVFRETLGDRAIFADPADADAIASAVDALPERDRVVARGPYDWSQAAEVLRELVTRGGQRP